MKVYPDSPAFPNSYIEENGVNVSHIGIDARTYIATKTFVGLLASYAGMQTTPNADILAKQAIIYADALINELNKKR